MEPSKEPISVRTGRLNNQIVAKNASTKISNLIFRDSLLDTFIALYDECNNDMLKKNDKLIAQFVDKFRTALLDLKQVRPNIYDFEVRNVIGRGHFGEVNVVREKQTGDVYAMKTLRKCEILKQTGVSFHQEERDIMAAATSPWLTSLQYSFQDSSYLYFIMEFHSGGDLLALLERHNGVIPESFCQFYLAELTQAVNALHSMGYVHRDLKPENVLLDKCGHLKLADFGSAAKLSNEGKVFSELPVGTPEYIAPEVLKSMESGGTYGTECDYWSLGIVAYEICVGCTPFTGSALTSIYNNIMNYSLNLSFPEECNISDPYKDFIRALLTDGNARLNYKGCLEHPFFNSINWNSLRDEVPPFVPKVNSIDDTSNFIEIEHKPHVCTSMDNLKTKMVFTGRNLPFIGFTYTPDVPELEISVHIKPNRNNKNALDEKNKEVEYLHKRLAEVDNDTKDIKIVKKRLAEVINQLKKAESNRETLEKDLALSKNQVSHYKRNIEAERLERKEIETKALELIKITKKKWETAEAAKILRLNEEIEEGTQRITELCTQNNELITQLERCQNELENTRDELEELKNLQAGYKDKMVKVRELNRQSIVGVQTQLEKMNTDATEQIEKLQQKMNQEISKRLNIESELESYKNMSKKYENELEIHIQENFTLKETIENLREHQDELTSFKIQLTESKKHLEQVQNNHENIVFELKELLKQEKLDSSQLRKEIRTLNSELNKTQCALDKITNKSKNTECDYESQLCELRNQLTETNKIRDELHIQLREVQESDELNRSKVNDLEQLVARLEQGVARLEASDGQEDQIVRLETQLAAAHESLAIEKQEARTAKTNLWRKEKEISEIELDKRITTRELKNAEDKITTLNKEIENLSKDISNERDSFNKNTEVLQEKINEQINIVEMLTIEIQSLKKDYEHAKSDIKTEKESHERLLKESKKTEMQMDGLRNEKRECERQVNILKDQLERVVREKNNVNSSCEKLRSEQQKSETLLAQRERELQNLQLNHNVLREACDMLENQLENYDCLIEECEKKHKNFMNEIEDYKKRIAQLQNDVQTGKQNTNEQISLRSLSEKRVERLQNELKEMNDEKETLVGQLSQYKTACENLNEQLAICESQLSEHELNITNLKRYLEVAQKEQHILKEESSHRLTLLQSVKESNLKINHDLRIAQAEIESLKLMNTDLESKLQEQIAYYQQRELKSNATQQQQTKLINYLQSKLEEHNKKKKTFTDKLFRHSKKENMPPLHLRLNRDYETKLQEEKAKNKELSDELNKIKTTLSQQSLKIPAEKTVTKVFDHDITITSLTSPMEGFVKLTDGTKWIWEKKYLRLEDDTYLRWYDQIESTTPISSINLTSNELTIHLTNDIPLDECKNITERDHQTFIFKIETKPKTTCWPKTVLYIMTTSMNAKLAWVGALNKIIPNKTPLKIEVGKMIWKTLTEINTLVEIDTNILLVGTMNGIYSIKDGGSSSVLLGGVKNVLQLDVHRKLGLVIMIAGEKSYLQVICLRVMEGLAKASSCSNPIICPQLILDDEFHIFEISSTDMMCAATKTQIIIFKYNSSNFTPVRMLDTAQPCSCLLLREHSLLVGANKFFEIDLRNFSAEEFLDASDTSLLQAVYSYKTNSYPIGLIDVSNQNQNEYLVCFKEFGIFVDEFGRRSREHDFKWHHVPKKIVYKKPYVFIFNHNSIELLRLEQFSSEYHPIKFDIDDVRFIGLSKFLKGSVFVHFNQSVHVINAAQLLDDDDDDDVTESEHDFNDQFSFTSSMVESLDRCCDDERLSNSESSSEVDFNNRRKVQFKKQTDL